MLTSTLLTLLVVPFLPSTFAAKSSKRGLVYVPAAKHPFDARYWDSPDSDLTWYYNYQAQPSTRFQNSTKLEFVPQLWGAPPDESDMTFYNDVKSLIDAGTNVSYILGFNEPDGYDNGGSGVDPELAARTWIREIEPFKKMGVKLGAPAVTGAPGGFVWLQKFFTACDGNCSADFIPVHWYGNFEGLASHVGQVNGTYKNMTMWITEYALNHADLQSSQAFYNQSADFFDKLDYVTRYSYFGSFRSSASNVGPNAAMLTEKGDLTDIGSWYLGGSATGKRPASSGAMFAAKVSKVLMYIVAVAALAAAV